MFNLNFGRAHARQSFHFQGLHWNVCPKIGTCLKILTKYCDNRKNRQTRTGLRITQAPINLKIKKILRKRKISNRSNCLHSTVILNSLLSHVTKRLTILEIRNDCIFSFHCPGQRWVWLSAVPDNAELSWALSRAAPS